ncbi:MAG: hypothetical protein JNM48_15485 [Rhodospirillales bacterium]|nr:hypothetical protein [Rhodospirillales bacterium]
MIKNCSRRVRAVFFATATIAAGWAGTAAAEEVVSWKMDVEPILQARCVECHKPGGAGHEASGLDLTSYKGLMTGTKHGPIVIPGDTLSSNLLVLVEGRADPKVRMPHGQRPLLKQQIDIIRLWIKQGAKDN